MFEHYTPDEIVKEGMIAKAFGDVVKFVYAPETIKYTVIRQTTEGEEISTEEIDGYYGQLVNVETKLEGYKFIESDKDTSFELTANTSIILDYEEIVDTRKVTVTSDVDINRPLYLGTKVTLTAHLEGYEDSNYILQWQRSKDNENWDDIEGANEMSFTYTIDFETVKYMWRVVAIDIE
jgi:hypothetical protein